VTELFYCFYFKSNNSTTKLLVPTSAGRKHGVCQATTDEPVRSFKGSRRVYCVLILGMFQGSCLSIVYYSACLYCCFWEQLRLCCYFLRWLVLMWVIFLWPTYTDWLYKLAVASGTGTTFGQKMLPMGM